MASFLSRRLLNPNRNLLHSNFLNSFNLRKFDSITVTNFDQISGEITRPENPQNLTRFVYLFPAIDPNSYPTSSNFRIKTKPIALNVDFLRNLSSNSQISSVSRSYLPANDPKLKLKSLDPQSLQSQFSIFRKPSSRNLSFFRNLNSESKLSTSVIQRTNLTRSLCSSSEQQQQQPQQQEKENKNQKLFEFQHQEITGPTVERDTSALAEETRQRLHALRRSVYNLSSALVILGFVQLGIGTWIIYASPPTMPVEVSVQGVAAFAFPFSSAFLLRRALKPMSFFHKMEDQGRLQVLTLALQNLKSLDLLFKRTRVLAVSCVVGVFAGTAVALWMRVFSSGV